MLSTRIKALNAALTRIFKPISNSQHAAVEDVAIFDARMTADNFITLSHEQRAEMADGKIPEGLFRSGSVQAAGAMVNFLRERLETYCCSSKMASTNPVARMFPNVKPGQRYNLYTRSRYGYKCKNMLVALKVLSQIMGDKPMCMRSKREKMHVLVRLLVAAKTTQGFNQREHSVAMVDLFKEFKINPLGWLLVNHSGARALIDSLGADDLNRVVAYANVRIAQIGANFDGTGIKSALLKLAESAEEMGVVTPRVYR